MTVLFFLIPAFLLGLFIKNKHWAYLLSINTVASLWLFLAVFQDAKSNGVISERIAGLFSLPNYHLVYLIMLLLGMLIGFCGCFWARCFKS